MGSEQGMAGLHLVLRAYRAGCKISGNLQARKVKPHTELVAERMMTAGAVIASSLENPKTISACL